MALSDPRRASSRKACLCQALRALSLAGAVALCLAAWVLVLDVATSRGAARGTARYVATTGSDAGPCTTPDLSLIHISEPTRPY